MPDCGVKEFERGGVIAEARIVASQFVDGEVDASTLKSCAMQTLTSVDADSARVIADAIAALPEDALAALAKAVATVTTAAKVVGQPATTTDVELPTSVVGNREGLLGKPEVWLEHQGYAIPAFKEA